MTRGRDDDDSETTGIIRRGRSRTEAVATRPRASKPSSVGAPSSSTSSVRPVTRPSRAGRPSVLVDKLFEHCAFERMNLRLYDATLTLLVEPCAFEGGPTRERLKGMARAELTHFQLLATALLAFGRDPTKEAGAAFVPSIALIRLHEVVATGGASFTEVLHALLLAELADNDGWAQLVEIAEATDEIALAQRFREALELESEHLALVRGWISAHTLAGLNPPRRG